MERQRLRRAGDGHYALQMNASMGEKVVTFTTFISDLLIWNLFALLAAWLFAFLRNEISLLN